MVVAEDIDQGLIEEGLIRACRQGDRDAFRLLFEAYKDRVYSIALRYTGNDAEAMDVAQDCFIKLFARIGDFRGEAQFETWLYRLVVNCCLDYKRKYRRWVPLPDGLFDRIFRPAATAQQDLERDEVKRRIHTAVDKLTPLLRMAVVLRYTEGLSYEEIAGAMGCSIGTVASRLNRAHKELAHRLAALGKERGTF
jgi:RNA polymerase sigma-70 factor (ECF subfamily)